MKNISNRLLLDVILYCEECTVEVDSVGGLKSSYATFNRYLIHSLKVLFHT